MSYVAEFQFRYNNRQNPDIFGTLKWLQGAILVALTALIVLLSTPAWLPLFYEPECRQEDCKPQRGQPNPNWERIIAVSNLGLLIVTACLAAATMSVARSTHKAANAAGASAKYIPAVESAYIFVEPKIVPSWAFTLNDNTSLGDNSIKVEYVFTNYGNTPAVIQSIEAHLDFWTEAPDNTKHAPSKILMGGEVILKPGQSTDRDVESFAKPFDLDARKAFEEGHACFWFYGSVNYLDIFNRPRTTRFRWRYTGVINYFGPSGGAPYNERT
jgi:hypothetical protein